MKGVLSWSSTGNLQAAREATWPRKATSCGGVRLGGPPRESGVRPDGTQGLRMSGVRGRTAGDWPRCRDEWRIALQPAVFTHPHRTTDCAPPPSFHPSSALPAQLALVLL